ncbi:MULTISPECIES: ATP-dependent Clp protease proteolytic subunit [Serratia]|uniref:ATP-dependent Clp protease proteolytic subunit n=1 Tax=Serratia TaxID=613 RepID=UPI001CBD4DFE|nr:MULTISPECIES: ATP-dependent Clp protease proteolytic subunit [Serratia]
MTVARLLGLSDESSAPINFLICSPGGHVESGDVIHDVIRFISAPVNMIGSGWVGSAAVNVFLSVPITRSLRGLWALFNGLRIEQREANSGGL